MIPDGGNEYNNGTHAAVDFQVKHGTETSGHNVTVHFTLLSPVWQ